jgi:hypothetical protein
MNVSITSTEAECLAAAAGRRIAQIRHPIAYPDDRFAGVSCHFLLMRNARSMRCGRMRAEPISHSIPILTGVSPSVLTRERWDS